MRAASCFQWFIVTVGVMGRSQEALGLFSPGRLRANTAPRPRGPRPSTTKREVPWSPVAEAGSGSTTWTEEEEGGLETRIPRSGSQASTGRHQATSGQRHRHGLNRFVHCRASCSCSCRLQTCGTCIFSRPRYEFKEQKNVQAGTVLQFSLA